MAERTTFIPPPCPVVLAVGCRGAMVARLRDATADLAVYVEVVELVELAAAAAVRRPLAILFSVDTYAFDPEEFDALTRSVGARRILVEEDEPCERLETRLAAALREPPALPEDQEEPPASSAHPPTRSGIRWVAARNVAVGAYEAAG